MTFQPFLDLLDVGDRSHLEHTRQIDARHGRADRRRARRQHEFVVFLGGHFTGDRVPQVNRLVLWRNANGLAAGAHVNCKLCAKRLLRRHQQA